MESNLIIPKKQDAVSSRR